MIAIAPAFTIGFGARFVASSSSIALKLSPVGDTPTFVEHDVTAVEFERQPVHEQLRDRLDRERVLDVADEDLFAVERDRGDRETIRIHRGEFGDVRRRLAVLQWRVPLVQLDADLFEPGSLLV